MDGSINNYISLPLCEVVGIFLLSKTTSMDATILAEYINKYFKTKRSFIDAFKNAGGELEETVLSKQLKEERGLSKAGRSAYQIFFNFAATQQGNKIKHYKLKATGIEDVNVFLAILLHKVEKIFLQPILLEQDNYEVSFDSFEEIGDLKKVLGAITDSEGMVGSLVLVNE